jgi:hypothetical protein
MDTVNVSQIGKIAHTLYQARVQYIIRYLCNENKMINSVQVLDVSYHQCKTTVEE